MRTKIKAKFVLFVVVAMTCWNDDPIIAEPSLW